MAKYRACQTCRGCEREHHYIASRLLKLWIIQVNDTIFKQAKQAISLKRIEFWWYSNLNKHVHKWIKSCEVIENNGFGVIFKSHQIRATMHQGMRNQWTNGFLVMFNPQQNTCENASTQSKPLKNKWLVMFESQQNMCKLIEQIDLCVCSNYNKHVQK